MNEQSGWEENTQMSWITKRSPEKELIHIHSLQTMKCGQKKTSFLSCVCSVGKCHYPKQGLTAWMQGYTLKTDQNHENWSYSAVIWFSVTNINSTYPDIQKMDCLICRVPIHSSKYRGSWIIIHMQLFVFFFFLWLSYEMLIYICSICEIFIRHKCPKSCTVEDIFYL